MSWETLKKRLKIILVISDLVSEKTEIKIRFPGLEEGFVSKVVKVNLDDLSSTTGNELSFIIEKMRPEKGNTLIQSASTVILEFISSRKRYRCSTEYMGISSTSPYFGFLLKFPETMEFREKRLEGRVHYGTPAFVSAEFRLPKKSAGDKIYELNVMNCSSRGLGLIIDKDNLDLIEKLKTGDPINDMTYFATNAMCKIDGLVKHITRIENGENKGNYQLGIESREVIDHCGTG